MPIQTGQFSEKEIHKIAVEAGLDVVEVQKIDRQLKSLRDGKKKANTKGKAGNRKDDVPARPMYGGRIYEHGPFSLIDDDLHSLLCSGGTEVTRWIPTGTMKARKTTVQHLDWVAPEGYTGAETYPEFLSTISIGECGYGPSTSWSGFSYQSSGGSFSWTTTSMRPFEDGGLHYYEEMPLYTVRGENMGMASINNDSDWAIARVLHVMETHLDYVIKFGDRANSEMEWDGLDQIVRPGYVAAHLVGTGIPTWADPIWVNGATLTGVTQLAKTLRVIIRLLRNRAKSRNWSMRASDMAVLMPQTMWDNLSEFLAMGAMYRYSNSHGFTGEQSYREFKEEFKSVLANGIDVDGIFVPVMTDPGMGAASVFNPGTGAVDAVTGDVYVLTRSAGGMQFWNQEYLDWGQLDYPNWDEDRFKLQGGIVRAGWVTEASKCYYYFAEMAGRLSCTMLPMQARISNVSIPVLDEMENESPLFYNPDYYPFRAQGVQGGTGTDLLHPV